MCCFEIHPSSRLRELQVGEAADLQELQHFLSVRIYFSDFLIQGGDLRDTIISPFSLLLLQLDGSTPHRASLNPLHQVHHIACYVVTELLAEDDGDLLTHACWP